MIAFKYINLFILGFLTYHIFNDCGCGGSGSVSAVPPEAVKKQTESIKQSTTIGNEVTLKEDDCGCS